MRPQGQHTVGSFSCRDSRGAGSRSSTACCDTFVSSYHDLLAKHQQALRDLTAARRHNEELHTLAQPCWATARRFGDIAQHRYDVSQGRLRQAIQREAEATQDNERLRIETQGFGGLRARYALLEDTTTEAYTRLQDYAMGLEWRLANSQHSSAVDPSTASPFFVQDLLDLRDENVKLRQRNADCESRCRTANADRDTALKDPLLSAEGSCRPSTLLRAAENSTLVALNGTFSV
ncbi:hypothetical protein PHYPSEUDO_005247 [Phytophthora pseudosyringae]|uniref:Uncharacterized protein n=1 Tax=Phytophthora pseudosyringae TaxID=221518 RepID=A0A8T1WFE6_9STRA|nr:hypothetical protein PHYPSEUDO_005247 [Phytophthora pseudosyringae]